MIYPLQKMSDEIEELKQSHINTEQYGKYVILSYITFHDGVLVKVMWTQQYFIPL